MSGGFTNVFGGSTTYPAPITLASYTIPASSTLITSWAVDNFPAGANPIARINTIVPANASCILQLPPATNATLGETGLFINASAFIFQIQDSIGNTIVSLGAGTAWYVYLSNNSTAAGVWGSFQFGAGVSVANAAALAGAGLIAIGPTLNQSVPVTTLSTNYTSSTSDRGKFINWVGGAGTITLPLATTAGNNFFIQVRNSGSGTFTAAASGGDLINGSSTMAFNIGDSAFLVSDSNNWWTIGYGVVNSNIFNFLAVNLTGQNGTYVLPANQQNKVAYRFTGALAGNSNISVPTTIQQYWVDNETTGATLGIGTAAQIAGATQIMLTAGARYILYCDGVNVLNADTQGLSIPVAVNQGGTGATTAPNALINLGGTSVGTAIFTTANVAAAQTTLQVLSASDASAFAMGF